MAKHRVPVFLSHLPKDEKDRLMKQFIQWKKWEISELMVSHYQKELDQLTIDEENEISLSWFQSKWTRVKRLGQRKTLRKIINDLKD